MDPSASTRHEKFMGRSELMVPYYGAWEQKILNALTKMTVSSLMEFAKMLNVRMKRHDRQVQRTEVRPFVRIIASLSAPDIIFDPTPQDIAKTVAGKVLKGILEGTKHFFRWYRHTCVEVQRPVRCSMHAIANCSSTGA